VVAGGSGIVIVKELNKATGVWSLKSQFSAVKSGTWVQAQCSVSLDYLVVAGGGGGGSLDMVEEVEQEDIEHLFQEELKLQLLFIQVQVFQ
jgi:hypothetical protein